MNKLLQLELIKFRHSRAFVGIGIAYAVLVLIIELSISNFSRGALREVNFDVWRMSGYGFRFLHPLLGIIIITNMTAEYINRTMRQHIIDGLSREQFLGAKLTFIATISVMATLFATASVLLFGIMTGSLAGATASGMLFFVLGYLISCAGMLTIAFTSSLVVRNTGFAITVFFVYIMVELIFWLVSMANSNGGWFLYNYMPAGSFFSLFPSMDDVEKLTSNFLKGGVSYPGQIGQFVVATIWLAVFNGINYYLIKKKDI